MSIDKCFDSGLVPEGPVPPPVPRWTRGSPSEPGWYWAVPPGGEVHIADVRDGLAWGFALDGSRYGGSWWLGPLPVPPLPQEEQGDADAT